MVEHPPVHTFWRVKRSEPLQLEKWWSQTQSTPEALIGPPTITWCHNETVALRIDRPADGQDETLTTIRLSDQVVLDSLRVRSSRRFNRYFLTRTHIFRAHQGRDKLNHIMVFSLHPIRPLYQISLRPFTVLMPSATWKVSASEDGSCLLLTGSERVGENRTRMIFTFDPQNRTVLEFVCAGRECAERDGLVCVGREYADGLNRAAGGRLVAQFVSRGLGVGLD